MRLTPLLLSLLITVLLTAKGQAQTTPHKAGQLYCLIGRGVEVGSTLKESEYRALGVLVKQGYLETPTVAKQAGILLMIENDHEKPQIARFVRLAPGEPDLAQIDVLSGKYKGKTLFVIDAVLQNPEQAVLIDKKQKELESKLAKIDPAEIVKAIKQARAVASGSDLSLRKKVFTREKSKRLTVLAIKYGVTNPQLAEWIAAKNLDN